MEGMDVSKDEDLYDIGLPNWEVQRDPRRKPIKTFINAVMNDETGNFKLSSNDQRLTGVDHKTLHKLVLKRHEKIAHHFSTGVGLTTQFMDSRIAEEVMLKMMHEDVLVLPIHDSFIVRLGFANWLYEEMENAFRTFVKATVGITVEGTKGNEHFGLPMDEVESRVVPLGSKEAWDAFESKNRSTMGRYLGSWVFLERE